MKDLWIRRRWSGGSRDRLRAQVRSGARRHTRSSARGPVRSGRPWHTWPLLRLALFLWVGLSICAPIARAEDRLGGASDRVRRAMAKKITLTFKSMPIEEALSVISEQAALDMAVSAGVKGQVSLFLTDVAVGPALDIITEMTGNAYLIQNNILLVIPEEDFVKQQGRPFRGDRVVRAYPLQYITLKEATTVIGQGGILTATAKVYNDEMSNQIVVQDVEDAQERLAAYLAVIDQPCKTERLVVPLQNVAGAALLEKLQPHVTPGLGKVEILGTGDRIAITDLASQLPLLQALVSDFDATPRQVLMEVKILAVACSDENMVGINWDFVQKRLNILAVSSTYPVLSGSSTGAVSSGTVLTFRGLEDRDFRVMVDALATYGKTDIVSLPRIVAVSGEKAQIHVGASEPFVSVSSRENQGVISYFETVTQVAVGVQLEVTPIIHPNDFIEMAVKPEVSSVSRYVRPVPGARFPWSSNPRWRPRSGSRAVSTSCSVG